MQKGFSERILFAIFALYIFKINDIRLINIGSTLKTVFDNIKQEFF
ncbi:hypothetical protein CNEO4_790052 [Clostridium neonatale]|nr:hypothetical protein CNEO4_790052 [Clostridium neonatale]